MRRCLIVAYLTMGGRELTDYLAALARRGPMSVHVVVPVHEEPQSGAYPVMFGTLWTPAGDEIARRAAADLDGVLARLKRAGIDATGEIGPSDPIVALIDAEAADSYDELIISTLPPGASRWLRMDVPHRARRRFGERVTTIVNRPGRYALDRPMATLERQRHIHHAEQQSHERPVELLVVDSRWPFEHGIEAALGGARIRTRVHRATTSESAARVLDADEPPIEVVAVAWGVDMDDNVRLLRAVRAIDRLGDRLLVVVGPAVADRDPGAIAHALGASAFVTIGPLVGDSSEAVNAVLLEHVLLGRARQGGVIGGTA